MTSSHWSWHFASYLILSEKKVLAVSLTSFAPHQFLEQIITTHETWVNHYRLDSKAQSMA
jgi:hypothetical protein